MPAEQQIAQFPKHHTQQNPNAGTKWNLLYKGHTLYNRVGYPEEKKMLQAATTVEKINQIPGRQIKERGTGNGIWDGFLHYEDENVPPFLSPEQRSGRRL